MKKTIFTFLVTALLLTSCGTDNFYQLVYVDSNLEQVNNDYIYEDGNCCITYNFWGAGGDPGFIIKNKTNSILYVDLGKTFYIKNNVSNCYYKNRTFSHSKALTSNVAVQKTATVYGEWALSGKLGSKSVNASSSEGVSSASGVSFDEKEIVSVAPNCCMYFSEFSIVNDVLQDCSVSLFPGAKDKAEIRFDKTNTPVSFGNYITYRVGEKGKDVSVTNNFFISKWANYRDKDICTNETYDCKKIRYRVVYKHTNAPCFYVKYDRTHNNHRSLDENILP